jgi:serine protease Do
MIAVNTAIARLAADGLPITSISFSLKSSVAAQWLREQGVNRSQPPPSLSTTPLSATNAASDAPVNPPSQQGGQPETKAAPQTKAPSPPSPKPEPPPARPYDLDALISDRAKAEADLEGMISEMRGRMKGR